MARQNGSIDERRWSAVQRIRLQDAGIDLLCFVSSYRLRDGSWGEPKLEVRREWKDSGEPGKREGLSLEGLTEILPYIVKGGKLHKALVDARKRWLDDAAETAGRRRQPVRRKVERAGDDDDNGADASDAKVEALEAKMAQMFELLAALQAGGAAGKGKGRRAAK